MSDARKESDAAVLTAERERPDEWLSLPAAAKAVGKSRHTVLILAADGELELDRRAGLTFVSRTSVERYLARRATTATQSAAVASVA